MNNFLQHPWVLSLFAMLKEFYSVCLSWYSSLKDDESVIPNRFSVGLSLEDPQRRWMARLLLLLSFVTMILRAVLALFQAYRAFKSGFAGLEWKLPTNRGVLGVKYTKRPVANAPNKGVKR